MIRHVPIDEEDLTVVTPGGTPQTWVYAPALEDLLKEILNELKIIRMHQESITDENIKQEDINDNY